MNQTVFVGTGYVLLPRGRTWLGPQPPRDRQPLSMIHLRVSRHYEVLSAGLAVLLAVRLTGIQNLNTWEMGFQPSESILGATDGENYSCGTAEAAPGVDDVDLSCGHKCQLSRDKLPRGWMVQVDGSPEGPRDQRPFGRL
jgi:hypothetical protein